jgi:hypothetical protein
LAVYVAEQALEAGDYSRAGIINASRNIDYVPGILIDGVTASMNAEDAFYPEATQLVRWDDTGGGLRGRWLRSRLQRIARHVHTLIPD